MSDARAARRPRTKSHYRDPLSALIVAAVVYFLVLLLLLLVAPILRMSQMPSWLGSLFAFLLVWVSLTGAVVLAGRRYGHSSLARDAGLTWRWTDIGLGAIAGLVVRLVVEGLSPTTAGQGALDGRAAPSIPLLIGLALGAVVVAPFVEELFFRGLLQRSVAGLVAGGRAARIIVSVLVSTPLFVLLHLATASPGAWGGVTVTSGLGGVLFGVLAATTRRLGASVAAHAVFNALGLLVLSAR